jgi:hypothetical protein
MTTKHVARPSLLPLLQAEYVRCTEEVDVLATVRDRRKAFAVALPGAEGRALQARGQDSKRSEQLQLRMVSLLQQLGKDEPLDPAGEEYKTGLAALRDQQLQGLQTQVEREVAAIAVSQQRGVASTQAQKRRAAARRKKVRQLVAAMQTWQQTDLESTEVVQQLPATWGDDELAGLFEGKFPWRQSAGANQAGVSLLLAEQFRDACAEVRAHAACPPPSLVCLVPWNCRSKFLRSL